MTVTIAVAGNDGFAQAVTSAIRKTFRHRRILKKIDFPLFISHPLMLSKINGSSCYDF